MQSYLPCPILSPYIKEYMVIESLEGMVNKTLPDTAIVMAFRFKGTVDYKQTDSSGLLPKMVISGLRKSPRTFTYYEQTSNLLVKFKEGGATAFFNEPLHELFSISLSLDSLIKMSILNEIEEQLAVAIDDNQRIIIIENFLISRLNQVKPDLLVQKAIHNIQLVKGNIRINELMNNLPLSRDAFEKRFRKSTSTTPKQYASIVKLNNLVNNLNPGNNLLDTVYTSGYFDQSHFIKDFKTFTGELPHNFIKQPRKW
ncbi:helix-turn-helix domain-containing protein [Flavobacterium cerinum]|uniref:Helix-turn-helix domain-containing protein n=1 Tax=Flavobacterium cerinum TaxID=2502784 RepID=A0A444HB96_9FLAO|nr:helix-turn-helix domain-containing protein [Flavobacterium cerinum]